MLAARETKMLSAERMERMIDAPTNDEAAKILEECGYGDLSGLSAKEAGAALEAHIRALFDEVEGMVPEAQLVQLFRLKYDYHNAKALIKAQAMGVECDAILSQRGTVPPQKLHAAFYEEDYRDVPPVLAQAMASAAAILAHTTNPQAADFELDRAYFAQMLDLADGLSDGGFAKGYVQLQIDSANLRAAVRTRRMAKDADFLKTALIPGGTIGTDRVLAAFDSAEALTALYGNTWLGNAAAAGAAAMSGGALTAFELLCDNALMDYIRAAKLRSFGAAHVTAYLAAMENETTAARMILTADSPGFSPRSSGKGCVRLMLKIAVVGGAETVMGFKALGLEACPVANAEEARETLRRLTKDSEDYAIIYVEENLAQELQHEIDKFKDVPLPAIILIPGREGPLGLGQTALKAAVERAVGSDIL